MLPYLPALTGPASSVYDLAAMLNSLDFPILIVIMTLGMMARFGGWRGWQPPRDPF